MQIQTIRETLAIVLNNKSQKLTTNINK